MGLVGKKYLTSSPRVADFGCGQMTPYGPHVSLQWFRVVKPDTPSSSNFSQRPFSRLHFQPHGDGSLKYAVVRGTTASRSSRRDPGGAMVAATLAQTQLPGLVLPLQVLCVAPRVSYEEPRAARNLSPGGPAGHCPH